MNRSFTLLFIVLFFLKLNLFGQTTCPNNIDFENGNFTNWTCYTGIVGVSGTTNVVSVTNSGGPIAGRHVITTAANGNDPYGNFPILCPTGGGFSLRLGNDLTGDSAERVRYKIRIPSGISHFSILYSYAVVLDDGGSSHLSYQQPRFNVEAFDSATNNTVKCLPSPYVATASLPGFSLSNVLDPNGALSVWYQPWTTRTLNLSGLGGKTIYVQFTTADCTLGAHFGYAYVDVQCGLFQITNGYCPGSTTAPLSAPPGYQSYSWRDSLYNVLGSSQNLIIVAPAQPKKIIVILTPYSGYGCQDTLTTYIYPLQPPVANFIRPDTFCAKSQTPFFDSSYSVSAGTFVNKWHWNFGDTNSGTADTSSAQNPTHIYQSSGHYTVSLIVKSNLSCISDTVKKTIYIKPNIAVNAGVDTTICYNTTALLHGTVTPVNAAIGSYTYAWSPSTGLSCATCKNTTTPNLTAATTYYFTTNYYPNGCLQTDTIVVNVAPPSLTITAQALPTTACPNSPVQLSVSTTPTTCGIYNGTCSATTNNYLVGNAGTTRTYPFLQYNEDGRTQMLYLKSELNAAGLTTGGIINAIAMYVSQKNSSLPYTGFNIKIGCTALTSLSSWQTGLTTVYSSTISTVAGWNSYPLSTLYSWDGVSNLIVEICYDNTANQWTLDDYVWATNSGFNSVLYYYDDGVHGCTMTSIINSQKRPDIRFGVCLPPSTGLTYNWSPSAPLNNANIANPIATLTATTTTTFTVTASSGTCNSSNASVVVTVNNLQANFTSKDTVCLGSVLAFTNTSTSTATDSVKKYYWNFGDATSGASNIVHTKNSSHTFSAAGTFTVTLVDTTVSGCIATFTKSIVVITPFTVNAGLNDSVCAGGTKILSPTIVPNTGAYTYSWSPNATLSCSGCISPTASPTSTTTYTLLVTSTISGCTANSSVTIKLNPASPIPSATASPTLVCPNGTAQLTATIPTPTCGAASISCSGGTNYVVGRDTGSTYYPFVGAYSDARTQLLFTKTELNAAGINAGTIGQLALYVATKSSTIPYSNFNIKIGCTALTSITSWQTGLTTVFTAGSITTVGGTWNNFSLSTPYSWDGNSNLIVEICFDNSTFSNYDFVNYSITPFNSVVYNYQNTGSGCTIAATPLQATNRPIIRFNVCPLVTNVTYSWSPTPTLSNANIYNPVATVNATTTYTVSVSNGVCPANTANVTVNMSQLNVNAGRDTSICIGKSVPLNATASGTGTSFTYSWSPSTNLSNSSIANPVATPTTTTTYILTVTDNNLCSKKDTVVITIATTFSIAFTSTNVSCFGGNNGSVTANVTPTGTYSYSWNTTPTQISNTATNLSAGIYTVTVSNGTCSAIKNDTITQPTTLSNIVASMVSPVSCFGGTNGTANCATPSGGTSPYTYSWNTTPVQTTQAVNALSVGTYTVTVTDAKGCSKTDTAQITQPTALSINAYMTNPTSCFGGNNGTANCAMPSGGTSPYTYSWNTIPIQTTQAVNALSAGTYTITVTDAKGCSKSDTAQIIQPSALSNVTASTLLNDSCFGNAKGKVTVSTPTGGTSPYSFSWNSVPIQTTQTANSLPAGTYTVTVKDANNCSLTSSTIVTQPTLLSNVTASTLLNDSCFGNAKGKVTVTTPTGGTSPYSFSWNSVPIQTTQTANSLPAGTYTVTVKDANNCSLSSSTIVTQPTQLTNVTASTLLNDSCFGNSKGKVTVTTPTGGTSPYSFSWNTLPIQTTQTANALPAGTYTITVKDANNCSLTSSTIVTQPTILSNVTASTLLNDSCFGNSKGKVTVSTPIGGTSPYSFSWNSVPIQTTQTANSLPAGTYTVTVKDANNCSLTSSTIVTQPSALANITASTLLNDSCFGNAKGKVTVSNPNGGTSPYFFSWNSIPIQTTQTANALPASTYTVTVKDANNCSLTSSTIVTQPLALSNVIASTLLNNTCFGGTIGKVTVSTPTGGTSPYSFSWNSSPIQTTQTANGLPIGTYTVTVKDANNCSLTSSTIITEPSGLANVMASTLSNDSCFGNNNGKVTVTTPTGGTAPYNYSWNTSPIQTTQTAVGLPFGTYTVTVSDAHHCSTVIDSAMITQPTPLANVVASIVSNVSCFGGSNGSVTVSNPSGGTAPYSFSWNSSPIQTTQTANALPAGTYTVTVKDAHHCSLTSSIGISQPNALSNVVASTLTNVICNGKNTGSATVSTPSGGTTPYHFSWNSTPIQTTQTANALPTGIFTVTVKDSNNCSLTSSTTITQPAPLANVVASVVSNVLCHGGNNGSVTCTTPTGATLPYHFSWNTTPVQTTQTATGLIAGTYTVSVTDSFKCDTLTSTIVVTEPTPLANVVASTLLNDSCFGYAKGKATVTTPTGGTTPYSFSWNSLPVQTTQTATNLPFGTYTVTVTDAHNCPAILDSTIVTQPTALSNVVASVVSNVTCFGLSNGSVTVSNPTGGTSPYSFSWNSSPIQNTQTANSLPAGTFTVKVEDANRCSLTSSTIITQPNALANVVASMTLAVSCFAGNNGTATCTTPTGGTLPYHFSWNSSPIQTTQTATGLNYGVYTVTVNDSNNCSLTDTTLITQPTVIANVTASTVTNEFCFGGHNGSASVSTPTGGTPPYAYSWNTSPVQTTPLAVNLLPGNYTVSVTDAHNCPAVTSSATITQPPVLTGITAFTIKNLTCSSGNDGVVSCSTPTGGTPPYSYSWNSLPIQTTQTATNLPVGTYTVTITDAHQCAYFHASTSVTAPTAPTNSLTSVVLKNVSCFGGNDAEVTVLTPVSGKPPFNYNWNSTPNQTTQTANNLVAGNYVITVTDSLGCVQLANATVVQPNPLQVGIAAKKEVSCFGANDGYINAIPAWGGTPPYVYKWNTNPPQTLPTATFVTAGNYTISVVDANGCTAIDSATIHQPAPISGGIIHAVNNPCSNVNAGWMSISNVSGGTPPYVFIWNSTPSQMDSIATNLPAGNYTVSITDAHSCTASMSATIITEPTVQAIAYRDTTINLGDNFTLNALNSLGINANTSIQWFASNGGLLGTSSTLNISPTNNEFYILKIFNDSICPSSDTVFINVARCGVIILPNAFSPNGDGLDDVFKILNPEDVESIDRFDIYNRWGQAVFTTNDKNAGWDGSFNNKQQPLDTYMYNLQLKCYGGKVVHLKGDVTLMR